MTIKHKMTIKYKVGIALSGVLIAAGVAFLYDRQLGPAGFCGSTAVLIPEWMEGRLRLSMTQLYQHNLAVAKGEVPRNWWVKAIYTMGVVLTLAPFVLWIRS